MDVVIFEVSGQRFALPASCIFEVLDPLLVTPLPYAPAYVDGLVNVAGLVMVQVDAAVRLGIGAGQDDSSGNAMVIGRNAAECTVHVTRVLSKINVDDHLMAHGAASSQQGDAGDAGSASRYIAGEFQWQDASVLLLELEAFSLDGITAVDVPADGGGLLGSKIGATDASGLEVNVLDRGFSCLIVRCNGERYGIPLREVGEVVDGFNLTVLPHAPVEVSGMALLRGAPLLALSLAAMLGSVENQPPLKMVVVEKNGVRFGLLAEDVAGIEYFKESNVQQVEHGMEIDGYLIGENDAMIGLLSLDGLLSEQHFDRYRNYLIKNNMAEAMTQTTLMQAAKVRLLTFRLGNELCAMPLALVERVEEYREATDLPGEGGGMAGAMQIQGKVVPVVDLRHEFHHKSNSGTGLDASQDATCLVVRMDDGVWALIVNQVERVVEIVETDIEPVKTSQTDFIGSVGRLNGKLISILTLKPLKAAPEKSGTVKQAVSQDD
jgi:purine-binding chemotaxis protein CheW